MKLGEYIKALQSLVNKHPEAVDYEVIYSHDDEGNAYQKVISDGTFVQVENLDEYFLELVYDEENESHSSYPNAIIIN